MDISYKEELGTSYMVLPVEMVRSDYEMRLVENGTIDCLLPAHISCLDESLSCFYDIGGKISLGRYLSKNMAEAELIKNVQSAIAGLPDILEDYLINLACIKISPETVFLSADRKKIYFCYYPGETSDYAAGVREIAALFIKKIDHQDEESVALGYRFFEVSSADEFSLKDLYRREEPALSATKKQENEMVYRTAKEEEAYSAYQPANEPLFSDRHESYDGFGFDMEPAYEDAETDYAPRGVRPVADRDKSVSGLSLKSVAGLAIPAIIVILTGFFLFSEVSENIDLKIRIVCFVLVAAAMALTAIILLRKNSMEKETKPQTNY